MGRSNLKTPFSLNPFPKIYNERTRIINLKLVLIGVEGTFRYTAKQAVIGYPAIDSTNTQLTKLFELKYFFKFLIGF